MIEDIHGNPIPESVVTEAIKFVETDIPGPHVPPPAVKRMKASDLIAELATLISIWGDSEVEVEVRPKEWQDISQNNRAPYIYGSPVKALKGYEHEPIRIMTILAVPPGS